MKPQHDPWFHLPAFVRSLILVKSVAEKRERGAVGAAKGPITCGVSLTRQIVAVSQIFSAASILCFSVRIQIESQRITAGSQLTFHVTAQIEISAMRHPF